MTPATGDHPYRRVDGVRTEPHLGLLASTEPHLGLWLGDGDPATGDPATSEPFPSTVFVGPEPDTVDLAPSPHDNLPLGAQAIPFRMGDALPSHPSVADLHK